MLTQRRYRDAPTSLKQAQDSLAAIRQEQIPMQCGFVELDDESKMDWDQVPLPRRGIKAALKELEAKQR